MSHRNRRISARRPLGAFCSGLAGLLLAGAAIAEDGPAVDTSSGSLRQAAPDDAPAVSTTPRTSSRSAGTTIYGDDDNPIGLYIIPWRASAPTPQMDRPARFIDETESAVDETQFTRFVEYYDALSRHRQAQTEGRRAP